MGKCSDTFLVAYGDLCLSDQLLLAVVSKLFNIGLQLTLFFLKIFFGLRFICNDCYTYIYTPVHLLKSNFLLRGLRVNSLWRFL